MAFQLIGPVPDSLHARGLIGRPLNGVHGKKVYMAEKARAEADKSLKIRFGVIYLLYEKVFEAHAPTGFLNIRFQGFLQKRERLLGNARHKLIPCFLDG